MDPYQQQRLQRFLSIADTIHDFGDMSRYPVTESTDTPDKRRELKERIVASLVEDISDGMLEEYHESLLYPDDENAKALVEIYRSAFQGGMHVPTKIADEDSITDAIKITLGNFGRDYFGEGDDYVRYEFDPEDITPEQLYGYLSELSGKRFVKYVLDGNQIDHDLFCVDPHTIKSESDCDDKDIVEYVIQKTSNELLELTEIGGKHASQNNQKYRVVYSYGTETDVPVAFQKKQLYKGITLFDRAIVELGTTTDLTTLQNTALQVIDDVFSLRCDRYANIYQSSSEHRHVSVRWTEPTKFPKALYDFKRAMDYLPVKAAKNANIAFSQHDMLYFYVSSDRLAIAYAILQGCPCILVAPSGRIFHIYNPKGQVMLGGRKADSRTPFLEKLLSPSTNNERTERDMKSYEEYMKVHIENILPEGEPETKFDKFLAKYRAEFEEQEIDYFWFVVYRFLFFFL